MATNIENRGLLNKMVKLIRGQPNAADDAALSEQDSEFNRDALKERIERKRQDDIVRKREFNHLRKLRNTSPLLAGVSAGRPSVFQNSTGFNPEDRALTVKKIDDIEATMSKHWLERKPGGDNLDSKAGIPKEIAPLLDAAIKAPSVPVLTNKIAVHATPVVPPAKTSHQLQEPSPQLPLPLNPLELAPADEFDFTKAKLPAAPPTLSVQAAIPPSSPTPAPTVPAVPAQAPKPNVPFKNSRRGGLEAGVSVFSSSKFASIEMGTQQGSADLHEAAIRFAEGDPSGAEEVLLAALKAESTEPNAVQSYFLALFDLYRAMGQQASFDVVAIDYAERFGQSAPEWFSLPELLGRDTAAVTSIEPVARPALSRQVVWECPAVLDVLAMKALRASLALNSLPKHLNWEGLKKIEPDAAKELGDLFARWCSQAIELNFAGTQVLNAVLKAYTPSSDMRVDPLWWQLRLDVLRVLHMRDDFESVALDFCVVYELSPPCWKDALCACAHELTVADATASTYDSIYPDSAAMGLDGVEAAVFELTGEILGDAAEAIAQLESAHPNAEAVVISCARLVRVDFSAAGSILNWAAVRQARGSQIQFRDVPRLVAAFFNVIGIDEHSSVVLRTR